MTKDGFKAFVRKYKLPLLAAAVLLVFLGIFYGEFWFSQLFNFYQVLTDKEQIKLFVKSFGLAAPLVFIVIQILQVVVAPIPGEISGFMGGYLFGAAQGFIYSTIGLTLGSWINFILGRQLGKHFVRRAIPENILEKFDKLTKREGIVIIFIFFILPGFPKDYLCLFLGVTSLPVRILLVITAVGRMPGTLMLSFQGALLFSGKYFSLAFFMGMTLLIVFAVYQYRENLYAWAEKFNSNKS